MFIDTGIIYLNIVIIIIINAFPCIIVDHITIKINLYDNAIINTELREPI